MNKRKVLNVSKLTKKYQATVPLEVRNTLGIQAGDSIVYEIEAGKVELKKASYVDWEYLQSVSNTLSEWESAEDEEAYCDL